MKKGFIILVVLGLFVFCIVTFFSSNYEIVKDTNYFLFKTRSDKKYLSFLEKFDNEKYEIVDISNTMHGFMKGESYMVTYKAK